MKTSEQNNRELLELAAKAAGLDGHVWREDEGCMQRLELGIWHLSWNPLADDGDALRLAVKLNMQIVTTGKSDSLSLGLTGARSTESGWHQATHIGGDPYAATRRAIVRAAAEIGRAML